MLEHQLIEAAGVGEEPAHHQRVGDRLDPVGETDRAVGREEADLGQFAPRQPARRGGVGVDFCEFGFAGAAGDEFDDRDVVDRRLGIGQRHHRRDAGRRRRPARRSRSIPCARRRARAIAPACRPDPRQAQPGEINGLGVVAEPLPQSRSERRDPVSSISRSPGPSSPLAGSSSRASR